MFWYLTRQGKPIKNNKNINKKNYRLEKVLCINWELTMEFDASQSTAQYENRLTLLFVRLRNLVVSVTQFFLSFQRHFATVPSDGSDRENTPT